ncbi:MAG: diaminopimelate epimerase [Betaproteobacteria bacterium]|nr:diaminopimelate epimerase [Betaproteobacteria bacterium]
MSNFAYMSGTGNDFLVGIYDGPVSEIQIIALVSDADVDIDGVIFVEPINNELIKMHYFNNDGSHAELCVNGVRCTAFYAFDNELVSKSKFKVAAPVGDIDVSILDNEVEIDAPLPSFENELITIEDFSGIKSNVGNPHFLLEVDDVDNFNLSNAHKVISNSPHFDEGVNLEIYQIIDNKYIKSRVFERGVGETDACGSGALCLFNYLYKTNQVINNSYVLYPGGDLNLKFEDSKLYLKGEVKYL